MMKILGVSLQAFPTDRESRGTKTATLLLAVFMALAYCLLLNIQRIFGEDNAGVIGIEMVAGEEGHAAEIDADIAFANAFTCGAYRNGGNRLNADIEVFEIVHRVLNRRPQCLPIRFARQFRPVLRQSMHDVRSRRHQPAARDHDRSVRADRTATRYPRNISP